jgi:murein L,D-transpeptidase YcbB/YkuD
MGQLKFSFANGEDIYLHDTPSKDLFAKPERALSNGCIRLEDARRFGHWLLGRPPVAPSAQPEQFVQLPQGVPVYVTYLTAQAVGGKIAYLTDIYGRDAGGMVQASALSAPSPLAGSVSAN